MSDVTARREKPDSGVEGTPLTVGTVLFLASDVMIFAGFFAAYFTIKAAAADWPPPGVDLDVTAAAVFTTVFACSALTIWRAVRAARNGDVGEAEAWLVATALLGLVFVVATLFELRDAGFGVDTHAYGTIYWLTIIVHWLHVVVGLALIAVVVAITRGRTRTPLDTSLTVTAYIWWAIVALSVVVFVVFYLIQ